MSSNFHFGDKVTQHGDHNIGIVKSQGSADPQMMLQEMIILVQALRSQVTTADRQVLDESIDVIDKSGDTEKGALRRALQNIAGVATAVGEFGVPVIDSVRKVMTAFGV
jgi:hypothetical protein